MSTDLFLRAVKLQSTGQLREATDLYAEALAADPDLLPRGPDFLIIGAARSGTTWLKKCLSRHPALRIRKGETNYFTQHIGQSPLDYTAMFTPAHFKGAQGGTGPYLQGEKSPAYQIMNTRRIRLCATLFPRAKIIFLIRHPVERGWSHLKHEDLPTEGRAYERILRVGRYEHDLMRWSSHFAEMMIVDFEDIRARPAALLAQIHAFLGVEPMPSLKVSQGTSQRSSR